MSDSDEDWRDVTRIGSQYEEQISEYGKLRHRLMRGFVGRMPGGLAAQYLGGYLEGGWMAGSAPDLPVADAR